MSRSDRDLVAALRSEIAAIDPSRACDRAAESAGLSGTPARTLAGRRSTIGRLVVRLGRAGARSLSAAAPTAGFDWASAPDHCRTAWLRGRFLANGSLSLAGGRTHLEFVVDPAEAPVLAS